MEKMEISTALYENKELCKNEMQLLRSEFKLVSQEIKCLQEYADKIFIRHTQLFEHLCKDFEGTNG